jgi:hypothetical protein
MTIQFNCPNCDSVIGFDDKYRGKRAQCTTCGQRFIIPSKNDKKAKKVKPPKKIAEPIPGFYRAVFIDSWKLFTSHENTTGLVFILTAVCFKFFVSRMNYSITIPGNWLVFDFYFPLGWILRAATWGILFWYYTEMIYSTAFDQENLPEVVLGGFYGLICKIIQSLYTIFIMVLVVGLPYLVTALILWKMEVEWPLLLYALMFVGLFLFPMAVLTAAIGKELTLLRPDYFLVTILRAFIPYMVTVLLLGSAGFLQTQTSQYAGQSPVLAVGHLLLNLAVQLVLIFAMRSIGLFHRHYSCYLPW